ncbi:MAG TPA: cation diffusion facilitator family transporter [Chitinophagales bacterium]
MAHSHNHEHHHLNRNENRTMIAVLLSLVAMAAELYFGYQSESVALEMEGWHMLSHVLVLALSFFTYKLIDWKVFPDVEEKRILSGAGFVSALSLLLITLWMFVESIHKLVKPEIDVTNAALFTAIIGLIINGIAAYLLHQGHDHDHQDTNIEAAYLHVLSDVLLGFFAIIALLLAKYLNWDWADGLCGILTSIIVLRWAYLLLAKSWREIQNKPKK